MLGTSFHHCLWLLHGSNSWSTCKAKERKRWRHCWGYWGKIPYSCGQGRTSVHVYSPPHTPHPTHPPPCAKKKKKKFVCLGKGKKRQIVLFLVPSIPSCMISTDSIILLLLLKFNMSFNNVYWSICFIFLVHFIRTSFDGLFIMRLMYLSDLGLWRTLTCFWRVLFYVLSRCLNLLNLGILVGWMQNS